MLIKAVLLFAVLSALFEFIIIMKIRPRTRLRILGSTRLVLFIHALTFIINISVHYGTVTGSMTAIVAALASFATVPLARAISGCIIKSDGRERYKPGLLTYQYHQIT